MTRLRRIDPKPLDPEELVHRIVMTPTYLRSCLGT